MRRRFRGGRQAAGGTRWAAGGGRPIEELSHVLGYKPQEPRSAINSE
jgi:hypothetical protein